MSSVRGENRVSARNMINWLRGVCVCVLYGYIFFS
jgi:hypothetical protein